MKNKKLLFFIIIFLIIINISFFYYFFNIEPELKSNIIEPVYIALYVGDIDGEVSEDWFFFYEKITDFYIKNKIPVVFSFYPYSIQDDKVFDDIFLKMYETPNIELMQKGYKGDELEFQMEKLSFNTQKSIIKKGQDHFKDKMIELTGSNNVKMPVLYNQIGTRINDDTIRAIEELGFIFYFDMYVAPDLEPVNSTKKVDVTQYGISFTVTGAAGGEEEFTTPEDIFYQINTYQHDQFEIIKINGKKFIPLWVHQQDFESINKENKLDKEKWKIYTTTVEALSKDPTVHLILPSEVYYMRH